MTEKDLKFNYEEAMGLFKKIATMQIVNKPEMVDSCVICANHTSFFDILAIIRAYEELGIGLENLHVLVADSIKEQFSEICEHIGAISVDRENGMQAGNVIKEIIGLVKGKPNQKVIIFPEGTRSRDGRLQELKDGASFIAKMCNMPIQTLYLKGCYEILPPNSVDINSSDIEVTFFPLIKTDKNKKEITEQIYRYLKGREDAYDR